MVTLQRSMSQMGMTALVRSGWPLQNATPSKSTPMNF